jgi:hypothetical protein
MDGFLHLGREIEHRETGHERTTSGSQGQTKPDMVGFQPCWSSVAWALVLVCCFGVAAVSVYLGTYAGSSFLSFLRDQLARLGMLGI